MKSLVGAALTYRSRSGVTAGERVGDVAMSGERGRAWLHWAARVIFDRHQRQPYDAARRGAARALLEVLDPPDAETLAQRDLHDELLTIAALRARAGDET